MRSLSGEKLYRIFLYFTLILFAVCVLIPVLWVAVASLKDNGDFYKSPWSLPSRLNFKNFSDAWKKAEMGNYFLNSLCVTALSLFILLITAIPASYALARFNFKGRRILYSTFMAGLFINQSYLVIPIFLMLTDINALIGYPLLLNSRIVLSVVYASCALPFTVYLMHSYFLSLPKDFEEAAYVDGCTRFGAMVRIMAPLARPGIITVILFNSLAFWNEYIIAITLMTDDSAKTLPVGLMNLMKAQNAAAEYGQMYAGLVIVMLPTLFLYVLVQKKLTEGLSVGGVKG